MSLEILHQIEQMGGRVFLDGDRLKIRIPKSYAGINALIEELRAHKPEIVNAIREQQRPTVVPCGSPHCGGCYSVGVIDGKERFLHPPKISDDWEEWLARWKPKGPVQ